jgi:hypothetical protein
LSLPTTSGSAPHIKHPSIHRKSTYRTAPVFVVPLKKKGIGVGSSPVKSRPPPCCCATYCLKRGRSNYFSFSTKPLLACLRPLLLLLFISCSKSGGFYIVNHVQRQTRLLTRNLVHIFILICRLSPLSARLWSLLSLKSSPVRAPARRREHDFATPSNSTSPSTFALASALLLTIRLFPSLSIVALDSRCA